jgi:hypothetical protein
VPLATVLVILIVLAGMAAAGLAPRPRGLHPAWFAVGCLVPVPGALTALVGLAVGSGSGLALAAAGGLVTCAAFWLLRLDPHAERPPVDWEAFERAAFEAYVRSAV